LITSTGRIQQFFIREVADIYQAIYGGVVFSQQILVDEKSPIVV